MAQGMSGVWGSRAWMISGKSPALVEDCRDPALADEQFVHLLKAYRASGGLARCRDVEVTLASLDGQARERVPQWLDEGAIFAFRWRDSVWIPWFQLAGAPPSPCAELRPILNCLRPGFDGWRMAIWFASPNPLLGDASPVSMVRRDVLAVNRAAQAWRETRQAERTQ
jgi:hypothetical protein